MKSKKILFFLPFFILPLTACDAFENPGDIKDYVGTYYLESATEKTYHIAWNVKNLVSEKTIMQKCSFVVNDDSSVKFTDYEGKETKGRIKCLEKYCRIIGTPLDRTFKFYRRNGNHLVYSYESKHMSAEYDVTYRTISFVKE